MLTLAIEGPLETPIPPALQLSARFGFASICVEASPAALFFARRASEDRGMPHSPQDPYEEFRSYRALVERYRRAQSWLVRRVPMPVLIVTAVIAGSWVLLGLSRWPRAVTVQHILAFPNCSAARAVGRAPARVGTPGYYSLRRAD